MVHYKGRITELLLESHQNASARLALPREAVPRAGQYLQAHNPNDPMEVVPASVFAVSEASMGAGERTSKGEVAIRIAGPIPVGWQPGTELALCGPLGRGFEYVPPTANWPVYPVVELFQ